MPEISPAIALAVFVSAFVLDWPVRVNAYETADRFVVAQGWG
jgi:hypothetical protein